jgi:hypothetical protein
MKEQIMRQAQIILFILGAASLIASAFGLGKDYGETLYNAGIAILLIDIVFILLWPSAKRQ